MATKYQNEIDEINAEIMAAGVAATLFQDTRDDDYNPQLDTAEPFNPTLVSVHVLGPLSGVGQGQPARNFQMAAWSKNTSLDKIAHYFIMSTKNVSRRPTPGDRLTVSNIHYIVNSVDFQALDGIPIVYYLACTT